MTAHASFTTSTGTISAINSAISTCPAGQKIVLAKGAYSFSSSIIMKSGVTLVGGNPAAYPGGTATTDTILTFTGSSGNGCIQFLGPYVDPSTPASSYLTANITGGLSQGSKRVTLSSNPITIGFAVGDLIGLDQLNDPSIPVTNTDETNSVVMFLSRLNGTRCQGQFVFITAITSTTVDISHPISMGNYVTSLSPQIWRLGNAASVIQNAGLEDLTCIQQAPAGVDQYCVYWQGCANCWAKNCSIQLPQNYHFRSLECCRIEIRHCLMQFQSTGGGGAYTSQSYSMNITYTSFSLLEDNISNMVTTSIATWGGGNCGNVFAYNYATNNRYDQSQFWQIENMGCHGAHPHMNLFEGNFGTVNYFDDIHGSNSHLTSFRNRLYGRGINPFQGSLPGSPTTSDTFPIVMELNCHFHTCVGNVLGTTGYHHRYQDNSGIAGGASDFIYVTGYNGARDGSGSSWTDAQVNATLIKLGNWNAVDQGINSSESLGTQTLSPSWFYTSQPAWWPTSLPWPWVDVSNPTVDPLVSMPAGYRFQNHTEAPSSTAVAPSPPTVVTAVAQSSASIQVSWHASSEGAGQAVASTLIYLVEREPQSTGNFTQVGTTSAGVVSFLDNSGLSPSTQYGYRVRAQDPSLLQSTYSTPIVQATTQPAANTTPVTPVITSVDSATSTTLTVTWPDTTDTGYPQNTLTYDLQRSLTQAGTYATIAGEGAIQGTGNGLSYINTGLNPVTTYWYRVSATNGFPHTSPFSTPVSGITTISPPAFVQSNTATAASSNTAQVSFNSAQVAGNTNVIVIATSSASAITIPAGGVTDLAGNTYTLVAGPTTLGTLTQWIYATPI